MYRTNQPYHHDETQNECRADLAEHMLTIGSDCEAQHDPAEVETDVSDALAMFVHFCARAGLDWDAMVERAERSAEGDLNDGPEAARDRDRFPAGDEPEPRYQVHGDGKRFHIVDLKGEHVPARFGTFLNLLDAEAKARKLNDDE